MPALAHLFCHWLLGALAAWLARRAPSLRQHVFAWPLMLCLALAGVLLVPITTFQARMYPDYSFGYALNSQLHPQLFASLGLLTLGLLVANVLALCAGFALTRHMLLMARPPLVLAPFALGAIALGVYGSSLGRTAFVYGDYSALWGDHALPFTQTPSAWLVPVAYGACIMVLAKVARWAGDRPLLWP